MPDGLMIDRSKYPTIVEYAQETHFEKVSTGRFRGLVVSDVLNHLSQNALEYIDEYLESARVDHGFWQLPWVLAKENLSTAEEEGEFTVLPPLILHEEPVMGPLEEEEENEYLPMASMSSSTAKPLQNPRVRALSASSTGSQQDPEYDYPFNMTAISPSKSSPRYKTPPKGSGGLPPPLPPKDKPAKPESQYMVLDLSRMNNSDYAVVTPRRIIK